MKLLHLSDLHLGRRLNEFSMIDDQKHIIGEILKTADAERPDGVIIAGDIYDRAQPSAEAVEMFDDFLFSLSRRGLKVFAISGNHDSPERIAFGSRIMDKSGIYLSPVYDGHIRPVTVRDEYGEIDIYLLPYVRPANVRRFSENAERTDTYTDAVREAISAMNVDSGKRNILVTHQYVTDAVRSESEDFVIGGLDNVDGSVFDAFDYVALGHLHRPQNCGTERIRYCGSPVKYSFSEAKDRKSVTIIELREKGDLTVRTSPLTPLHEMREIRGRYNDLMNRSFYENTSYRTDYMHITLTDEEDIPNVVSNLRVVYGNLMKLDYDNARTRGSGTAARAADIENRSPAGLFADFYKRQNNQPMSDEQLEHINALIEEITEGER